MADLISDGKTKVAWATTISDITAPTETELATAKDWTERLTPDGLQTDPTTAEVDTSSLASTYDTTRPGRTGYSVQLTFKRGEKTGSGSGGNTDDEPFRTLKYGVSGFLVIRRGLDYDIPFAEDDEVEVYPATCGEPQHVAPAANTVAKFISPMFVTSPPATSAIAVGDDD
ncbi:phage tail tube protein [Streptomyces sp. NPDC004069]